MKSTFLIANANKCWQNGGRWGVSYPIRRHFVGDIPLILEFRGIFLRIARDIAREISRIARDIARQLRGIREELRGLRGKFRENSP